MASPGALLHGPLLLGDQDYLAVLLVPPGVLLTLAEYSVIVGLGDAHELAVVAPGPHHSLVEQFVHGGHNAEAAKPHDSAST